MKFKNATDEAGAFRSLIVSDKDSDTVSVEVTATRVYIGTSARLGVSLTRAKALKFAQELVVELS